MTIPVTKIIACTTILGGTIGGISAFSNRVSQLHRISENTVKDYHKPMTTVVADSLVTTADVGIHTVGGFVAGSALTLTAPLSLPIHIYTKNKN